MTEALAEIAIRFALTITTIQFNISSNAKDGVTRFNLRDDGVDVGTEQTIAASTTGKLDSGIISEVIAVDSVINWEIDTVLSTSGAINITCVAEYLLV